MNGIVNQYIKTSYKRNGPKSWLFVVSVNHHRATGSNVFVPGRACTRTMRVVANPPKHGKSSLPVTSSDALSPSTPDHHPGSAQRKIRLLFYPINW